MERVTGAGPVLEVGCGIGVLAFDLADRGGIRLTAVDVNEKSIATAKEKYAHPNIEFLCGDALVDLPAGAFDVVVMSNVLEHLPDRANFLLRLKEATGFSKIIIRVPLFERDWRVPLKQELGLEWRGDLPHETENTLGSFARGKLGAKIKGIHQEGRRGGIWGGAGPLD